MKNILITRIPNNSQELANHLEKQGCKIYFQPLFKIYQNPLPQNFFINQIDVDLNVIITSANALWALPQLTNSKSIKIFTVGAQSANLVRQLGFDQVLYPQNWGAQNLSDLILSHHDSFNIVYLRGEKISYDFKTILLQNNFNYREVSVYKTQAIDDFSCSIIDLIKQNFFDEILIFSQNSLEIFYKLCVKNNLIEYLNCIIFLLTLLLFYHFNSF